MNVPFPCIFPLCHVMTVSKFSCLLGDFFEGITNRPVLYKFHILAYIHKHIPINSYLCIYKHTQKYVCIYKNLTLFSKYIALLHQPVLGDPNTAGPGSVLSQAALLQLRCSRGLSMLLGSQDLQRKKDVLVQFETTKLHSLTL